MPDFLPTREADLVTWSTNFSTKITAAPTTYGLVAGQATTYAGLHDDFVAAYLLANAPATRSPTNIIAKDEAKRLLKANARVLAAVVQAWPSITDELRSELGLTVPDATISSIPAPTDSPKMDIISAVVRTVTIRLHDINNPTRRGRPDGVAGASVFSAVGTTPPVEIAAWKFEGSTSRTTDISIEFDASVPSGATVWLCAFWFNSKMESGPACAPVSTNLPGGAVMSA